MTAERATDIRFERQGALGIVCLDRPRALNALTRPMVQSMSLQLLAWAADPTVAAVLVKAVPGKAFCAGGDIRAVTEEARRAGVDAALGFFHDEYRLNWRIHHYPKPYVALLDGIVMGGGVGISVHGAWRVVTANTMLAMPETAIGFFPDVGGTRFLSRCPGATGTYLGLTGARLGAADCLHVGAGTHLVDRARLEALEAAMAAVSVGNAAEEVRTILSSFALPAPEAPLAATRDAIDRCFAADDVGGMLERLREEGSPWAQEQLDLLAGMSPLSLHVTHRQVRLGRSLDMTRAMRLEYHLVRRFLEASDFYEGVRALLVDKDRQPRWRHRDPLDVRPAEVDHCFDPGDAAELPLDWTGL
jgi:enoyl-CoA hydratase